MAEQKEGWISQGLQMKSTCKVFGNENHKVQLMFRRYFAKNNLPGK